MGADFDRDLPYRLSQDPVLGVEDGAEVAGGQQILQMVAAFEGFPLENPAQLFSGHHARSSPSATNSAALCPRLRYTRIPLARWYSSVSSVINLIAGSSTCRL